MSNLIQQLINSPRFSWSDFYYRVWLWWANHEDQCYDDSLTYLADCDWEQIQQFISRYQ